MLRNVFRKNEDRRNTKEMVAEDSTLATPRLNFFKRVKQRILSAIIRRPPAVPQHLACEAMEDDCSIESRREVENLIEMLPMELLAHVASYLPVKDFNSLARTNRNNHGRLAKKYRRPLRVNLRLLHREHSNNNFLEVSVLGNGDKYSTYTCVLKESDAHGNGMGEEEKLAKVERFYRYEESEVTRCYLEFDFKTFKFGLNKGLEAHLMFLHSEHTVIDSLTMVNFDDQLMNIINDFLVGRRVKELCLQTLEELGEQHLELIRVSHAQWVTLRSPRAIDGFFRHPSIRKLVRIDCEGKLMQEGDLPMLEATQMNTTVSGITARDIKTFLTQWSESRRNVERYFIRVSSGLFDPARLWRSVIESLDRSLVDISATDETHRFHSSHLVATIRRQLDRQAIMLSYGNGNIFLSSYTE